LCGLKPEYLLNGLIQKKFANPHLVEKTDISTNTFLCGMADRLSTLPSIYLSIACPVLDKVPSAGDIVENKTHTHTHTHTHTGEKEFSRSTIGI